MRVLGSGQRSADILPASICRQDGGAPVLPNLPDFHRSRHATAQGERI